MAFIVQKVLAKVPVQQKVPGCTVAAFDAHVATRRVFPQAQHSSRHARPCFATSCCCGCKLQNKRRQAPARLHCCLCLPRRDEETKSTKNSPPYSKHQLNQIGVTLFSRTHLCNLWHCDASPRYCSDIASFVPTRAEGSGLTSLSDATGTKEQQFP